jgi:hypothetical protein
MLERIALAVGLFPFITDVAMRREIAMGDLRSHLLLIGHGISYRKGPTGLDLELVQLVQWLGVLLCPV